MNQSQNVRSLRIDNNLYLKNQRFNFHVTHPQQAFFDLPDMNFR